jgi:hypothetical protein
MARSQKPAWTWAFEEGVLTIDHRGTTVSLGRYANHEYAAKAAALYIAKHDDAKGAQEAVAAPPR